jgi:thiol-disulfide isomerase/thioredoxin
MKKSIITASALSLLFSLKALSALPATQPTTKPMANTFEAFQLDGTAAQKQYKALSQDNALLADGNPQRSVIAPDAIVLLKKCLIDLDGMARTKPVYKWPVSPVYSMVLSELYALGDADTVSMLNRQMDQPGRDGIRAKRAVLRARWYMAGDDTAKQTAVLADVAQLAQLEPGDAALAQMIGEIGTSTQDPDIRQQLVDVLTKTMDNQTADAVVRKLANDDKTHSFESKPMVLSGNLPDGKPFTTADWKGKVILVDFWAAWCTPCKAELPRIRKVYEQYHDKGFEVLGVDNDQSAKAVIGYSAKANLPWPQLFDATAAAKGAWNPITVGFGIEGIPVMFLIDKKGVCRTVTARDSFEKLIPQMLAE